MTPTILGTKVSVIYLYLGDGLKDAHDQTHDQTHHQSWGRPGAG